MLIKLCVILVLVNHCVGDASHTELLAHVNAEHHAVHSSTTHEDLKSHVTIPLRAIFESRLPILFMFSISILLMVVSITIKLLKKLSFMDGLLHALQALNSTLSQRTDELKECKLHEDLYFELQYLRNITSNIQTQMERPFIQLNSCLSELNTLKAEGVKDQINSLQAGPTLQAPDVQTAEDNNGN